jgi:hypothetical protein
MNIVKVTRYYDSDNNLHGDNDSNVISKPYAEEEAETSEERADREITLQCREFYSSILCSLLLI